ncbi:MAG: cobyrinate a,c-diamide synthase, partial [Acidobacteria bacterium]|nr:cobyrinate a,c-diamide synthase [Acidobacteriota bacterium]
IAGTGGDCGKTAISLGLTACWRKEGLEVAPFKKGPDYIDAAWLSIAAGRKARNLDTWMMGAEGVLRAFAAHAIHGGINLIEGNRGLHDGEDARGTHSSAALAKLLGLPVVLILPATKATRTAAAVALGMKLLDPDLKIAGVLLNRIATSRQETIARSAIEAETGLPVLGSIPRVDVCVLPGRHMGLVTPQEHAQADQAIQTAEQIIRSSVDFKRIRAIAEAAAFDALAVPGEIEEASVSSEAVQGLRIGYFESPAFTFYYPENLEAIVGKGAFKVAIDPLKDSELPQVDALYIGGGFPETHAARLAANAPFRRSVAMAAGRGLPVWAECGGLMFLSRSIQWKDSRYPMAGFLPADVTLAEKPAGHGYEEVLVDRPNPFIKMGSRLRGHEFHYSQVRDVGQTETAFEVKRGTGLGNGRDGMVMNRVLASYLHLHSLASPELASGLVEAAIQYRREENPARKAGPLPE